MDTVGTLVIGAGVIGSAVAMHLADMGAEDVCVVDPDLAGARSSSERNAGGVRANWWQPINVALSVATIDWLATIAAEVAFHQHGYLWMYDETLWPGAQAHAGLQRALGREVELLSARDVADRQGVLFVDMGSAMIEGAGAPFNVEPERALTIAAAQVKSHFDHGSDVEDFVNPSVDSHRFLGDLIADTLANALEARLDEFVEEAHLLQALAHDKDFSIENSARKAFNLTNIANFGRVLADHDSWMLGLTISLSCRYPKAPHGVREVPSLQTGRGSYQ